MSIPLRTKWLGIRDSDPTTDELAQFGEGAWWFNTTDKRFKWYNGSAIEDLPMAIRTASSDLVTIPIGGGSATVSLSAADFNLSKIGYILDLEVERKAPIVNDVYAPSYGINATGDGVGVTLAAASGTTLSVNVMVLGTP